MAQVKLDAKIDPKIKEKIEKMVENGEYASISDFVKQAIQFYLNYQQFCLDDEVRLVRMLKSETGRELLKEALDDLRSED